MGLIFSYPPLEGAGGGDTIFFSTYFLCLPCKESNKEKSPLLKFTLKICRYFPARFWKLDRKGFRKPRIVAQKSLLKVVPILAMIIYYYFIGLQNTPYGYFCVKFKRRILTTSLAPNSQKQLCLSQAGANYKRMRGGCFVYTLTLNPSPRGEGDRTNHYR